MSTKDKIAFVVVIVILALIASFCTSAALTLPPPSNGGPVLLTFIVGIAIGCYTTAFVIFRRDK